jgi:DNA repair exonuclease SbcCD ATPase subunit
MAEKDVSPNSYCFKNLLWVPDDNLPEIDKIESYSNNKNDKEIIDLLTIQDELCQKLEQKEEEIVKLKETINKLLQQSINPSSKIISYEKYEMALKTLQEEQEKNDEIVKVYDELRTNFDQYRQKIEKKVESLNVGNLLEQHNRGANENEGIKTQQSMNSFNNMPSVILINIATTY